MRKLTVRINRYDPERDDSPRWEKYHVEADPMGWVLDVLLRIEWEQDPDRSVRLVGRRPAGPLGDQFAVRLHRLERVLSALGTPSTGRAVRCNLLRISEMRQFRLGLNFIIPLLAPRSLIGPCVRRRSSIDPERRRVLEVEEPFEEGRCFESHRWSRRDPGDRRTGWGFRCAPTRPTDDPPGMRVSMT